MLSSIPVYIAVLFAVTSFATLFIFIAAVFRSYYARHRGNLIMAMLLIWLAFQALLSANGFYEDTRSIPPKLILALLPPTLVIILLFITRNGRAFIDSLPLQTLTWLSMVRIPVEIGLYGLFVNQAIPALMTFEGRNLDILSGLSAPFIAWFGYRRQKLAKSVILWWNIICLLLVLSVVIHGVLSVPTDFQQFAFDQPNIAVLYFPFIWLPAFIVPVVVFSHLVSIRQLLNPRKH